MERNTEAFPATSCVSASHRKIVDILGIESKACNSKDIKVLPASKTPLRQVNQLCRLLKLFLRSHSGFIREDIQGYLDIFVVMTNHPNDKHEKTDEI